MGKQSCSVARKTGFDALVLQITQVAIDSQATQIYFVCLGVTGDDGLRQLLTSKRC